MQRVALVLVAVGLAMYAAGTVAERAEAQDSKATTIRATSIVLVDEDGHERVYLQASRYTSGLWVNSPSGPVAAVYASRAEGAVMGLYSKVDYSKGKPLDFAVATSPNARPFVQSVGADGKLAHKDVHELAK